MQTSERVRCQVDLKTYASESERTGHMVLSYNGTWSTADLKNVPPTLLARASRERLPRHRGVQVLSQEALEELPREFPSGIGPTECDLTARSDAAWAAGARRFCCRDRLRSRRARGSEGLKKQEVVRTSTRMKEFCLGKIVPPSDCTAPHRTGAIGERQRWPVCRQVQREGMCVVFFFDDMSCSEPDNDKPEVRAPPALAPQSDNL